VPREQAVCVHGEQVLRKPCRAPPRPYPVARGQEGRRDWAAAAAAAQANGRRRGRRAVQAGRKQAAVARAPGRALPHRPAAAAVVEAVGANVCWRAAAAAAGWRPRRQRRHQVRRARAARRGACRQETAIKILTSFIRNQTCSWGTALQQTAAAWEVQPR